MVDVPQMFEPIRGISSYGSTGGQAETPGGKLKPSWLRHLPANAGRWRLAFLSYFHSYHCQVLHLSTPTSIRKCIMDGSGSHPCDLQHLHEFSADFPPS